MLVRLWFLLIVAFVSLYAYRWSYHQHLVNAGSSLCKQVADKIYLQNQETQNWYHSCIQDIKKTPIHWNKTAMISWLQSRLDHFGLSHLDIWTPQDMQRTWEGEDLDLGIVVKNIEGHFIVFKVYPNTPAENKLQFGDEILSIEGQQPSSVYDISSRSGTFEILRGKEKFRLYLEAANIKIPLEAKLESIPRELGTVELSLESFIPIYYKPNEWKDIKKRLLGYDKVLIDLRGNTGGDFVVMLQYLSFFFCDRQDLGYLYQPQSKNKNSSVFTIAMDGNDQIHHVQTHRYVELRTFKQQECYLGEVEVLIDEETASTAEIFAMAMRLRKGSKLWGVNTAGSVLLAIWFPTEFGENYSLSIPVATYKNWQDQELEGYGVAPDHYLSYDLPLLRQGIDNWLKIAAN